MRERDDERARDLDQPEPYFDEDACSCLHLDTMHDDGFGCTMPGCDCLAGWSW